MPNETGAEEKFYYLAQGVTAIVLAVFMIACNWDALPDELKQKVSKGWKDLMHPFEAAKARKIGQSKMAWEMTRIMTIIADYERTGNADNFAHALQ